MHNKSNEKKENTSLNDIRFIFGLNAYATVSLFEMTDRTKAYWMISLVLAIIKFVIRPTTLTEPIVVTITPLDRECHISFKNSKGKIVFEQTTIENFYPINKTHLTFSNNVLDIL